MVHWIDVLWNNSFVNPTRLPLLCEKTGALAVVELGLMAGWQAIRQTNLLQRNLNFAYLTFKMHIRHLE